MKTALAIANARSAAALAKILKITPGAVSQWDEELPELRVYQLRTLRPEWFDEAGQPLALVAQEQPS